MSKKFVIIDGQRVEKRDAIEYAKRVVQEEITKCEAAYMELLNPDVAASPDKMNEVWRQAYAPWMDTAFPAVAFLYKVLGFSLDKVRDWLWEATNDLLLAETMRMNIEANLDIPVRPVNVAMFVKTG